MQLQRAQSLAQAGRHGDAWNAIAPLRPAIHRHGAALRLFALIAENSGSRQAAIDALKQILVIEFDPPEIVGALADTLGKAGHYAEAYGYWSRLVAKQPGAIDAHLNRSIAAGNAGRHDDAVQAAEEGLIRAPNDARLLGARALGLKNAGKVPEAVAAFDLAVKREPNNAVIRVNQAVTLRIACRYDEACDAYAKAAALGAAGASFESNWAAAALEAGRVDEAAEHYRKALDEQPMFDEARRGLTRLQMEYRGGDAAFRHYERVAREGTDARAWADYQDALVGNRQFELAASVGREALSIIGDNPDILRNTLIAEGLVGSAAAALDELNRLPAEYINDQVGLLGRAHLALRAHRPDYCARLALSFNETHQHDQTGWALLTLAWRLLDDPREHWLCDYDRLVMSIEVPSPDRSSSARDYAAQVAAVLDSIHTTASEPGDQSLRAGTQTSGSLFGRPHPELQDFRTAVLAAVATYASQLPFDSSHPFLSRNSRNIDVQGSWSVRLRGGGGHHVPHFHAQGWMSSAYYARLPKGDEMSREKQEGWIEFGRPPAMFDLDLQPRRVVEPCEGRLVLFPSYLWHGTRIFDDRGDNRLTAAFDFISA